MIFFFQFLLYACMNSNENHIFYIDDESYNIIDFPHKIVYLHICNYVKQIKYLCWWKYRRIKNQTNKKKRKTNKNLKRKKKNEK